MNEQKLKLNKFVLFNEKKQHITRFVIMYGDELIISETYIFGVYILPSLSKRVLEQYNLVDYIGADSINKLYPFEESFDKSYLFEVKRIELGFIRLNEFFNFIRLEREDHRYPPPPFNLCVELLELIMLNYYE